MAGGLFNSGCCCGTCDICTDTGGDGPCGIAQTAGTVSITTDFVIVTASDSIALSDQTTGSEVEVRATTKVIAGDDGDECELLIKSSSDGTTCYFARLTVGASATLKLYSRAASVDTLLATSSCTAPSAENLEMSICYGSGGLSARELTYGGFVAYALTTNVTTRPYAGVGTGTISNEVDFWNFAYYYGYNASGHSDCRNCYGSCVIADDDFNRADDTSIGADWTEVSGNWSITSNKLRGAVAGIVTHSSTYTPDEGVRIQASCSATLGDTVRYLIDYQDSDNYYAGEYYIGGSSGAMRIVHRSGGSETILFEYDVSLSSPIGSNNGIAYDPLSGRIYVGDVSGVDAGGGYLSVGGIPALTNNIAGLMVVSGDANFDDYVMDQILGNCNPPENCFYCDDKNNSLAIADDLQIVLTGVAEKGPSVCGSCATLNATYVLDLIGSPGNCRWRYTFPSAICDVAKIDAYTTGTGAWTVLLLDSNNSTLMGWTGSVASGNCLSNSITCATSIGGTSSCDPSAGSAAITIPA